MIQLFNFDFFLWYHDFQLDNMAVVSWHLNYDVLQSRVHWFLCYYSNSQVFSTIFNCTVFSKSEGYHAKFLLLKFWSFFSPRIKREAFPKPWLLSVVIFIFFRSQTLTSCPARRGMYSIIANLTLHLVSSASSTMAGNRLWDNCLIPITWNTKNIWPLLHMIAVAGKIKMENFIL